MRVRATAGRGCDSEASRDSRRSGVPNWQQPGSTAPRALKTSSHPPRRNPIPAKEFPHGPWHSRGLPGHGLWGRFEGWREPILVLTIIWP